MFFILKPDERIVFKSEWEGDTEEIIWSEYEEKVACATETRLDLSLPFHLCEMFEAQTAV